MTLNGVRISEIAQWSRDTIEQCCESGQASKMALLGDCESELLCQHDNGFERRLN
jgi:hypothetical protein